jgi:hypothetical protein
MKFPNKQCSNSPVTSFAIDSNILLLFRHDNAVATASVIQLRMIWKDCFW